MIGARPAPPVLAIGLNPTFQKTLIFDHVAPGEVNRAVQKYDDVAGKGANVARILGQLGDEALYLTHTGGDGSERFIEWCENDGIPIETVPGGSGVRTCTTVIDRSKAETTELIEPTPPVGDDTGPRLLERFCTLLDRYNTVVIAGTLAPGYPDDLTAEITARARRAGAFVLADYRGDQLKRTMRNEPRERPSLIKINLVEFAATFFHGGASAVTESGDDEEALVKLQRHLTALREERMEFVITRGSRDAVALGDDGELLRFPPVAMTPVNTIGSGDAFAAGLVHELSVTEDLSEAIERAHAVAAMNAAQPRPGTIRP